MDSTRPEPAKAPLLAALDKAARATGDAVRATGQAALAAGEAALAVTTSPATAHTARGIAETMVHLAGVAVKGADRGQGSDAGVSGAAADAVSAARIAASSVVRVADAAARSTAGAPRTRSQSLRDRGDSLLHRSSHSPDTTRREHPAFDHILDDLTPDEARILRFLSVAGPQPSIDVRTSTPLRIGSQRLAAGISFIADMAGCAAPDRSREYLGNLDRLGLIRFSAEPVDDFRRYYLLDAHPDTVAAMHRAKRTIAVYRSIYLSVFGEQFCAECFTTDGYDGGGWAEHDPGDHYWGKGPRLP